MSNNKYQSIPAFISKANPVIPMAETVSSSPIMMVREGSAANHLNDEQLAAVSNLTGPTVINAGAGTGKSTLLVERMRRIKQQYPEAKVLLVTFTKKSALEIKERIAGATGIQVSTFHSLSYHILIRDNDRKFTVLTSDSYRKSIIAKLIGSKSELSTEDIIFAMHSPSRAAKGANDIVKKYLAHLEKNCQMDMDAMQILALKKLENKSVCQYWAGQFKFILVDESQDLDSIELGIISKLSEKHKNLCCVGDTRQSIYGFRGSMPNVLDKIVKENDAMTYELTTNYRCTSSILGLANKLMDGYAPLIAANLFHNPPLPQYLVADDEAEEADTLIKEVQKLQKKGIALSDMAVLYRSSSVSRTLVGKLLDKKIPFVCSNLAGFPYNQYPLKGMVSLLRHINEPDNKKIWLEILPMLFLKKMALADIEKIMSDHDVSFIEAIKELEIPFFQKLYVDKFCDGITQATKLKPRDAIHTLIKAGYNKLVGVPLIPNCEALADEAENFDTIYAFLARIDQMHEEYEAMRKAASNAKGDCLRLMTIHASKGLEFQNVFIIGAYDGIIPAGNDGTDISEEKRLLYVAVTRAKVRLFISFPLQSANCTSPNEASRFLREVF